MTPSINDIIIIHGITGELIVTNYDKDTLEYTLTCIDPQHPFTANYIIWWFIRNSSLWRVSAKIDIHQILMSPATSSYPIKSINPLHPTAKELARGLVALKDMYYNVTDIDEDKTTCTNHDFKFYQGLYESFEYCTTCDFKRKKENQ